MLLEAVSQDREITEEKSNVIVGIKKRTGPSSSTTLLLMSQFLRVQLFNDDIYSILLLVHLLNGPPHLS
jgi:hypothetical protein